MRNIKGIAVGLCLAAAIVGFSTSSKATLIGTDVDVFLSVGGTTVINQTLSVTAPSSSVFGKFRWRRLLRNCAGRPAGIRRFEFYAHSLQLLVRWGFPVRRLANIVFAKCRQHRFGIIADRRLCQEARRRSPTPPSPYPGHRFRLVSRRIISILRRRPYPSLLALHSSALGLSVLLSRDANEPPDADQWEVPNKCQVWRSFGAAGFFCRTSVKGQQRLF